MLPHISIAIKKNLTFPFPERHMILLCSPNLNNVNNLISFYLSFRNFSLPYFIALIAVFIKRTPVSSKFIKALSVSSKFL